MLKVPRPRPPTQPLAAPWPTPAIAGSRCRTDLQRLSVTRTATGRLRPSLAVQLVSKFRPYMLCAACVRVCPGSGMRVGWREARVCVCVGGGGGGGGGVRVSILGGGK